MKSILESEECESRSCYNFPQQRKWVSPVSELLCQLSVTPEGLTQSADGQGALSWQRKETQSEIFKWTILMTWFWKSRAGVVLETTKQLSILNIARDPSQSSSLKYRPLSMTAAWLSRGAWWNQRYFHKIHARHTGVGLCTCILALTPEGTELYLLQDWNK